MSDDVITRLDEEPAGAGPATSILTFMSTARWFAGKGRRAQVASVTPLPWLTAVDEWPAVRTEVVEIVYPGDTDPDPEVEAPTWPRELYQVMISYRSAPEPGLQHAEIGRWTLDDLGPVVGYDGAQDTDACRVLLRGLLAEQTARSERAGEAEVSFHATPYASDLPADLEPSVFRGQQSNTSIMFGDQAMIKLFRRLELGHNLDIAVHDALSRGAADARPADVAKLFGWIEASWPYGPSSVRADLAMAVEKLADAREGWDLALESLSVDDLDPRVFAADAERLGVALREIHVALHDAFPTASQPGSAVAAIMKQRLSAAAAIAPALEPYVGGLTACFDLLDGTDLETQRVHGDFHLGQTLRTPSGWKIIDFEGEPVKTLAEREAPDSVWRDIAGMLRSFDYAAASVPGAQSTAWASACQSAFLTGYTGGGLTDAQAPILRAYVADKAVYEVVYEVRNRPDWVAIPVAAIAALVATTSQQPDRTARPHDEHRVSALAPSTEDPTKE